MTEFALVRIDDRLIHGQVIAVWCKHLKVTRIVIVDDGVAADSFMQEVLKLAAPTGLQVDTYSIAEGAKVLGPDMPARATTMVLLKTPLAARQLYDSGVHYKALNIGGIGSGPGRKNVFKNIAVSKDEIAILKGLLAQGVEITLFTVPGETSKSFAELAHKL